MARLDRLALRLSEEERQMLDELSHRLQRSPSDTVRLLIREFARSFAQYERIEPTMAHPRSAKRLAVSDLVQERMR